MYKKGLNFRKIKGGVLNEKEQSDYNLYESLLLKHVHDLKIYDIPKLIFLDDYIEEYNNNDNTNNVISVIYDINNTLNEETNIYEIISRLNNIYNTNKPLFNNNTQGLIVLMKPYLELYDKNVKTNEEEGKIEIKPQLNPEYFVKNSLIVLGINKLYNSLTEYKLIDIKDSNDALILIINNVFNFFINNIVIKSILDGYTIYDKFASIYYYDPTKKGRGRKALDTIEINMDEDIYDQLNNSIILKIQAKLLGKSQMFKKMILDIDKSIKYIVSKEYRPTLINEISNIKDEEILKIIKKDLLIIAELLQLRTNNNEMASFLFSLVKPIQDIEEYIKEIIKIPEPIFDVEF